MRTRNDVPDGCYSKGDSSEVIMYFNHNYLIDTIPYIDDYILKNS